MSSKVDTYEKLGAFYLGRGLHLKSGKAETPLLYDSKDLTTHAVCLGMTGSGKTGLGVTLLEEAAIDGVPSIVIDPKGDMANLLLTFPGLTAEEFRPWVDVGQAGRAGKTPQEFAQSQADLWKNGLAEWDQSGERIARLREAAEFRILTPGSAAGCPISILGSFRAPGPELLEDPDLFQDRISTTASSLLALLGINADPIRSREAILLSNVLDRAWREGEDLDLASMIVRIQDPPFDKVGILPLDSFYPAKERFELAMALNNLLASPSFQGWLEGPPLDVDELLYSPSGKPRVSVISIAHLPDAERMFFVSLLLGQVLGWMRSRPGTAALRAIVYMDEIFGYLPPTANPPSKKPLLTLLKQARAFGVGLVLATQNPVDLDYKALSNIGTWLIGRLQTERDQARVMDGLLAASSGLTRSELEILLAGLEKRNFLLHNVHEDSPALFRVRWAMSYLRGPITRQEIKRLVSFQEGSPAEGSDSPPERSATRSDSTGTSSTGTSSTGTGAPAQASPARKVRAPSLATKASRPVLPSEISQLFLPVSGSSSGKEVVYRPRLLGSARVHFVDSRRGLRAEEELVFIAHLEDDGGVDWRDAEELGLEEDDLERQPLSGATFADLPAAAAKPKSYRSWEKAFADMLYRQRRWKLLRNEAFGIVAEPGESERDFRIRVRERSHEERDQAVEKVRTQYGRKARTLEDRKRRAEQKLEKEVLQASQQKQQAWLKAGTSLLGAVFGRKTFSRTNMNKAGSVISGFGRSSKEAQDVETAEENIEAVVEQIEELENELQGKIDDIHSRLEAEATELGFLELKPRRADVDVRLVALGWQPWVEGGGRRADTNGQGG